MKKNTVIFLCILLFTTYLSAQEALEIDGSTGNVSISKQLIVTGKTTVKGDFDVLDSSNNSKSVFGVTNSKTTINSDLDVTGTTTTVKSNLVVTDTDDSILFKVTNSDVTINDKLTVIGGTVTDTLKVTSQIDTANIVATGNISAPSLSIINGLVVDADSVIAIKPVTLSSTLDVTGKTTIDDEFQVGLTGSEIFKVTNDTVSINVENLNITGTTSTVKSDFKVVDGSDVVLFEVTDSGITVGEGISVTGGLESNSLNITGQTNAANIVASGNISAPTLTITGGLTVDLTNITANKPLIVSSSLDVTGSTTIHNSLTVVNSKDSTKKIIETNDASVAVNTDLTLTGNLTVINSAAQTVMTVDNNSIVSNKAVIINGNLTVKENDQEVFKVITDSSDNTVSVEVKGILKNASTGNSYDALPKGTILMFSGTGFNETNMPGWYICDGREGADGRPTPSLVGKFIKGGSSSGQGKSNPYNTAKLEIENLPEHDHSIGHGHTTVDTITGDAGEHSHNYKEQHIPNNSNTGRAQGSVEVIHEQDLVEDNETTGTEPDHTHTVSVVVNDAPDTTRSGMTGKNDSYGYADAFNIEPDSYVLIYIIKTID